jgi:hypothetical protein
MQELMIGDKVGRVRGKGSNRQTIGPDHFLHLDPNHIHAPCCTWILTTYMPLAALGS